MIDRLETLDKSTMAALIGQHPASFIILSNDRVSYANDAAVRMFGATAVGSTLADLVQFCPDHPLNMDGQRFLGRISGDRMVRGLGYRVPEGIMALTFVDVTEEQRAQREALALAKMASGLTWGGSLAAAMESVASNAAEAVNAVAAGVVFLEGDPPKPRQVGSYNLPQAFVDLIGERWNNIERAMDDDQNVMAAAVQTGTIVLKRHVRQDLMSLPSMQPCWEYLRTAPWDCVVIVPMTFGAVQLGALTCYFPACQGRNESELRFLRAIADQAAVLVQNARLIDEVRDKALLEERQRLARELHDSVSQALFGIALGARTARTLADRDPGAVKEPLDYVLSLAEAGLAEMRALIFELRPETIDSEGLVAALERQLGALRVRHQLAVDSHLAAEPKLSSAARHALYRVAQEAIHNIVKHAAASHVDVELDSQAGQVTLSITDDGRGFAGADVPGHLGLRSMRERMAQVGGTLAVQSEPGHGTRVHASLPTSD